VTSPTTSPITGYPFFLQEDPASPTPIYYSAKDFRNYTQAFNRRPGVLENTYLRVTQGANVGMRIRIGYGWANVGGYIVYVPGPERELEMPWAKPTTGTVTHKVFLAVYDENVSGSVNMAQFIVTQDTGAGAPNPPGAAASLLLATVTVTSTQANIQNANIQNVAWHGGGNGYDYLKLEPWITAEYASAYNADASTGTADMRCIYSNGAIRLSGRLARKDGLDFATNKNLTICKLPVYLWPRFMQYLTGTSSDDGADTGPTGTMTFRLAILTDGTMIARIPSTQTPQHLMFDGISYDMD
jgi:hypothetical protein